MRETDPCKVSLLAEVLELDTDVQDTDPVAPLGERETWDELSGSIMEAFEST